MKNLFGFLAERNPEIVGSIFYNLERIKENFEKPGLKEIIEHLSELYPQ